MLRSAHPFHPGLAGIGSGMGGSVLSRLAGNDSGMGLTLGLDTEEQQGALKSPGIRHRRFVLLYLAPPSAVFQDEARRRHQGRAVWRASCASCGVTAS